MGRKRGRPRKAIKTVKNEEEKPVEKPTETKASTTEAESKEEGQTTKQTAAISLEESEADELTHVELEEPESKKPKLDAEAAGSTTSSLTDNNNEVEEREAAKETKEETSEETQPEKPAGGGDTIRIERWYERSLYI